MLEKYFLGVLILIHHVSSVNQENKTTEKESQAKHISLPLKHYECFDGDKESGIMTVEFVLNSNLKKSLENLDFENIISSFKINVAPEEAFELTDKDNNESKISEKSINKINIIDSSTSYQLSKEFQPAQNSENEEQNMPDNMVLIYNIYSDGFESIMAQNYISFQIEFSFTSSSDDSDEDDEITANISIISPSNCSLLEDKSYDFSTQQTPSDWRFVNLYRDMLGKSTPNKSPSFLVSGEVLNDLKKSFDNFQSDDQQKNISLRFSTFIFNGNGEWFIKAVEGSKISTEKEQDDQLYGLYLLLNQNNFFDLPNNETDLNDDETGSNSEDDSSDSEKNDGKQNDDSKKQITDDLSSENNNKESKEASKPENNRTTKIIIISLIAVLSVLLLVILFVVIYKVKKLDNGSNLKENRIQ